MRLALALTLVAALSTSAAAQDRMMDSLRKGIAEEEAGRNPNAAIPHYESAVAQFDEARKTAATALFRLAEAYRKAGRTAQAEAAYQRVVRDFGDQTSLVAESRRHLPATQDLAAREIPAERQRYRQLLVQKLQLAEQSANEARRQIELGPASEIELMAKQQALLNDRRAVAEFEGERARSLQLLQERVSLAQVQVQQEERMVQSGAGDSNRLRQAKENLINLMGDLNALETKHQLDGIQRELIRLENQKASLLANRTAAHPDVLRIQQEIARAQDLVKRLQAAAAGKTGPAARPANGTERKP